MVSVSLLGLYPNKETVYKKSKYINIFFGNKFF